MKILKGIISSLITVILIPVIMVFIVYLSTRDIASKQGVKDFFKEVNLTDLLVKENGEYTSFGNDIKNELVNNGVPEEVIDEFINSEEVKDFFTDYTGDIVSFIIYDASIDDVNASDVSKLLNDNIDDIVEKIRKEKIEGYEELTDERVNQIKSEIDEIAKGIDEKLPDVKKYVDDSEYSQVIKVIRIVFSKAMLMIFITVIAILSLLIVLLNLRNYRYGIWLGIVYILTSLPFIIIGNANITVTVSGKDLETKAIKNAIKFALSKMTHSAFIIFFIGVALIIFSIIMRVVKKQRGKKASNNNISTPVATVVNESEPVVNIPVETVPEETVTVAPAEEAVAPSVFNLAPGEEIKPVESVPVVVEETKAPVADTPIVPESGVESVCSECGAKLNAGQNFCYNCGATKK